MSRLPRIEYKGAWYHVCNHAISNQNIFEAQTQVDLLFRLFADVCSMYDCEIHAYLLTNNSYDLLIHTKSANISCVMRYLNGVYTQRYNKINGRKGPLFCGRYRSVLVHEEMYLLQVSRYIHWLPVLLGISEKPNDYVWSSYPVYCKNRESPKWLFCQNILHRFRSDYAVQNYMSYVEAGVDNEILNFYNRRHVGRILGPKTFIKEMLSQSSHFKPHLNSHNINNKPEAAEIIEYISAIDRKPDCGCKGVERAVTNKIAMLLCKEVVGHTLKDIAQAFGVGNPRSVSVIVGRLKDKIDADIELSTYYSFVREKFVMEYC